MEYLILLLVAVVPMFYGAEVSVYLNCSTNGYSCDSSQIISTVDEAWFLETSSRCGNCLLKVNTTKGYGIRLDVETHTSWSQFRHLSVQYGGLTYAFTGPTAPCSVLFPYYQLEAQIQMDSQLRFQRASDLCNISSYESCKVITDCDNFASFESIWKMEYQDRPTLIETDHNHPTLYKWYGWNETVGKLPECLYGCRCNLNYQRFVIHCDKDVKEILLVHPSDVSSEYKVVLEASNRQLVSVDSMTFQDLSYVTRLSLSKNLLTSIEPGTFGSYWIYLYGLELAENKLSELSHNVFNNLLLLVFLDLHGNYLTLLHADLFKRNRFLAFLDCSNNNLLELSPHTFMGLSYMRALFFDQNNITTLQPKMFQTLSALWFLYLDDNNLKTILPDTFAGLNRLYKLHLSGNQLTVLEPDMFRGAEDLKELLLSRNLISSVQPGYFQTLSNLLRVGLEDNRLISVDLEAFKGLSKLLHLQLSGNNLQYLIYRTSRIKSVSSNATNNGSVTTLLPNLKLLDLSNNAIQDLDPNVFKNIPTVQIFQLRGNPLTKVDKMTFETLENDTYVFVDEPATCCFISNAQCKPINPRQPYLTCLRLLPHPSLRAFMWIFGLFAFVGNLSVLLWRCVKHGRENIIQVLLIENLAASDLLMGVYMLIIASADVYYQQYFPSASDDWRNGPVCKLAGTLSVLSSEASVFFITLISIDRFLAIKYPRGKERLTKKSATISILCLWSLAVLLSVIPTSVSGLNAEFYDVSEVCIGLPFVRQFLYNQSAAGLEFDITEYNSISSVKDVVYEDYYLSPETGRSPGLYFSIVLFLGLNFLCFVIVAVCYIYIFILYKQSVGRTGTSRTNEEISLTIKMGGIVLTDFMCWMPIVIIGILVQSAVVTISPIVYVYIVVFILPINSALNPYIYTVVTIISDYRQQVKVRRAGALSQKRIVDGSDKPQIISSST